MEEQNAVQTTKYVTFVSGEECYGIKIDYVNEIIVYQDVTKVPETEDYIKGLINLRGKIIPVIDVRKRFGLEPIEYTDRTCIVVVSVYQNVVGLIVEKIAEVVELRDEDILPAPIISQNERGEKRYVKSIGKLGDSVKLILDPDKLLNGDDANRVEQQEKNDEEEGE